MGGRRNGTGRFGRDGGRRKGTEKGKKKFKVWEGGNRDGF